MADLYTDPKNKKTIDDSKDAINDFSKVLSQFIKDISIIGDAFELNGDKAKIFAKEIQNSVKDGMKPDDIASSIIGNLQAKLMSESKNVTIPNLIKKLSEMEVGKEITDAISEWAKQRNQYVIGVKSLAEELSEQLMKPFEYMTSWIEKIPGGKILNKMFGFDTIKKSIQGDITMQLANSVKQGTISLSTLKTVGVSAMSAIGAAGKAALAHPVLLAIALVIGAIMVAFKNWQKFYETTKLIRDETGLLTDESMKLGEMARQAVIDGQKYGVTMELAGKSVSALANEFQNIGMLSQELINNTSLLVSAIGMSADEAAKLQRTFISVGQLSDENAGKLALATANAARLGKVSPAKVLSDMAKSSKEINLYFRGNVTAAAKAAIELARMGLSLQKAAGIAKNLLEFDTSIESELEASVLLGRQINLGLARQYSFMGDIENATKQVLKQVGSLDSFNRMNVLQKEAIAKATGMEVDELANALKMQEKIASMDAKEKKEYDDSIKALEKFRKISKKELIDSNSRLLATEKLEKAWDSIVYLLSSALFPAFDAILPAIEELANELKKFFDGKDGEEFLKSVKEFGVAMKDLILTVLPTMIQDLKDLVKIMKVIVDIINFLNYDGISKYKNFSPAKNNNTSNINNISNRGFTDDLHDLGEMLGLSSPKIETSVDISKRVNETALDKSTPKMAEGGIVNSPQIIQAGEKGPEAIIPLDRLQNIINDSKTNNDDIIKKLDEVKNAMLSMRIYMDSKQVGHVLSDTLDKPGRG